MTVNFHLTTVPLGVPHTTTDVTILSGFELPKGTVLFPNIYSASIDPKHWDDPERFKPERFIDAKGNFKKAEAFVQFSAGKSFMPGQIESIYFKDKGIT